MIGKLSFWYKDNVSNEVDCLACRLISGIGLLGIGAYLLAQSKKRPKPLENYTMKSLAAGEHFGQFPVFMITFISSAPSRWFTGRGPTGECEFSQSNCRRTEGAGNQDFKEPRWSSVLC